MNQHLDSMRVLGRQLALRCSRRGVRSLGLIAAACCVMPVARAVSQGQWNVVWTEPFAGTQIDSSSWNLLDIAWPYNGEAQYYHPSAVTVSGGNMTITSTNVPRGGRSYTSGRLDTDNKHEFLFGRFEMRAKLPRTQGIWPAFWLLPSDVWPPEIDIMELLGHQPSRTYVSNHWGPTAGPQHETTQWDGPDFSASYNLFTCEWWPDRADFFVNGQLIGTHREQIPQRSMYIILNTAVGGFWPGYPDGSTVFPQRFDVDYVKVWQWSEPLMLNTGFDTSPPDDNAIPYGWARWGNASRNSQLSRQGPTALKLFGNFNVANNTSGAFQDIAATAGETWTASAMVQSPSWDRIGTGNSTRIKIEFRNASDQIVGQVSSPTFTRSDVVGQWVERSVAGTAPAGTAAARVVIEHVQGSQLAAGAVWWDDLAMARSVACDSIDFNNDSSIFDPQDIDAFLSVYGEGPCIPATAACNDIDFNNDGSIFDPADIDAFLRVFAEGPCQV